MNDIINGCRNPRFILYRPGEGPRLVELPLTSEKGLVESYEIKSLNHRLVDYTTLTKVHGCIIHFTLHYDSFVNSAALMKVKDIIDCLIEGGTIEIVPRTDMPWRKFEVYLSGGKIDLALLKGYSSAKGHRLPVLEFTTKYLLNEIPWSVTGGNGYCGTMLNSPLEGIRQE